MPYFFLLLLWVCVVAVYVLSRANRFSKSPSAIPPDWIRAGGALGIAIMLSRFFCVPLATILNALPFLLHHLRQAETQGRSSERSSASMTEAEARLILGVSPQADAEAVKQAHRNLITKNHPDKGGSDYLAAKINQARDFLLG